LWHPYPLGTPILLSDGTYPSVLAENVADPIAVSSSLAVPFDAQTFFSQNVAGCDPGAIFHKVEDVIRPWVMHLKQSVVFSRLDFFLIGEFVSFPSLEGIYNTCPKDIPLGFNQFDVYSTANVNDPKSSAPCGVYQKLRAVGRTQEDTHPLECFRFPAVRRSESILWGGHESIDLGYFLSAEYGFQLSPFEGPELVEF
jgi:hypothetical protein